MKLPSDCSWRWTVSSVTGPSHEEMGTPCEDVGGIAIPSAAEGIVLLALSDGAGSAAAAKEGAEIVVESWFTHLAGILSRAPDPATVVRALGPEDLEPLFTTIRRRTEARAERSGRTPADYSATLLGAVLTPDASFFAQVGDGCWVVESEGVLGCPTWPVRGEFAAETVFANSRTAATHLQCGPGPARCTAVAGFTDGIERLALRLVAQIPEPGFFGPLFHLLKQDPTHAGEEIRAFLDSPGIRVLSEDDKSLLVVVRDETVAG